jgi:pyruvate,orthophosphate dikinase
MSYLRDAKAQADAGKKVILMRPETSPEDIEGMIASEAIVTTHGDVDVTFRTIN